MDTIHRQGVNSVSIVGRLSTLQSVSIIRGSTVYLFIAKFFPPAFWVQNFFQNPTSPDSVKMLSLLCLGEIGKSK